MIPRLAGIFRITIRDIADNVKWKSPWFDNVVTNTGLNRIGLGPYLTHCFLGTGSIPAPSITDDSLAAQVGSTSNILSQSSGANNTTPYYGYYLISYKFPVGTASGNLAEVGVGWASGLFARALLVDNSGNPTVITVLPSESVIVTYLLKNMVPTADYTFSAVVDGTTHACIGRASQALSGSSSAGWGINPTGVTGIMASTMVAYNGAISTITGSPSGTSSSVTGSTAAYVNNSLERAFSGNWLLTEGNLVGGITSLQLFTSGLGAYQMSLDPPIPKTSYSSMILSFKVAWTRP